MADIDLGPDRDPARLKMAADGIARRHLHFQDHHRRRVDHRHARDEMPDRALRRHHQRSLGAHADLDEVACVHGFSGSANNSAVVPANAGTHNHKCTWLGRAGAPACFNNQHRWLWVPAFAGTTIDGSQPYFFAAAARSTNVLPPFILWASGASLIWITTASASTPRFLTSAWVMSRIMPAFCSSVRPAAMLTVISGIVVSSLSFLVAMVGRIPLIHDL